MFLQTMLLWFDSHSPLLLSNSVVIKLMSWKSRSRVLIKAIIRIEIVFLIKKTWWMKFEQKVTPDRRSVCTARETEIRTLKLLLVSPSLYLLTTPHPPPLMSTSLYTQRFRKSLKLKKNKLCADSNPLPKIKSSVLRPLHHLDLIICAWPKL